jgi:hypothetical protein
VYADKFGEVWRVGHDQNVADPTFACGHFSVIKRVHLTEGTLVLADKDHKIYVHEYPRTCEIRAILMGHTSPVVSIVVSGGAIVSLDKVGTLVLWGEDCYARVTRVAVEGEALATELCDVQNTVVALRPEAAVRYDTTTLDPTGTFALPPDSKPAFHSGALYSLTTTAITLLADEESLQFTT